MSNVTFPIDIVVTWVDQSDKNWQEKYNKFKSKDSLKENINHYRDYGTLKYLFRSIEKYAAWVNKVYLVTDKQVPSWLNLNYKKCKVIDHSTIINQRYLPTFNSNVIDFNLYKIPNLSEHFIYFNDDMFLNDYTKPSDFFSSDGKIRDNLGFNVIMPNTEFEHTYVNNMMIINNEFSKREIIKKRFFDIFNLKNGMWNLVSLLLLPFPRFSRFIDPHTPIAYKKSTIQNVLEKNRKIEKMFNNRTRTANDYSLWLVRYYEMIKNGLKPRNINFGGKYNLKDIDLVIKDIISNKHKIININDAENSTNIDFEIVTKKLIATFDRKLSKKSQFEK